MQSKDYKNFNEEGQTEQNIAVGVPINQNFQQYPSQNQPYVPYFQNPGQHVNNQGFQPSAVQMAQPVINQRPINGQAQIPQMIDYNQPINIICPCCRHQVTTIVSNEAGTSVYVWAGLLCCFINPCCVCVPFLTDKCMDRNHYCPSCGFQIMKKHRGLFDC